MQIDLSANPLKKLGDHVKIAGASSTAATLKLVCGEEGRSQGDIATAAMASINQFLSKQVTIILTMMMIVGGVSKKNKRPTEKLLSVKNDNFDDFADFK